MSITAFTLSAENVRKTLSDLRISSNGVCCAYCIPARLISQTLAERAWFLSPKTKKTSPHRIRCGDVEAAYAALSELKNRPKTFDSGFAPAGVPATADASTLKSLAALERGAERMTGDLLRAA